MFIYQAQSIGGNMESIFVEHRSQLIGGYINKFIAGLYGYSLCCKDFLLIAVVAIFWGKILVTALLKK